MEENIRVRYSDKELEEFKAIIEEKIKKAQTDLELIRSSYMNSATNGTDDTSPTFLLCHSGLTTKLSKYHVPSGALFFACSLLWSRKGKKCFVGFAYCHRAKAPERK